MNRPRSSLAGRLISSFCMAAGIYMVLSWTPFPAVAQQLPDRPGKPLPGGTPPDTPGTPTPPPTTPSPPAPGTPGTPHPPATHPPGPPGPPAVRACAAGTTLSAAEVQQIVSNAAAASADQRMTVAVVDRLGSVLSIYAKPQAPAGDAERAVALARTAAFFSNDTAPLSSRTVRFVSGIHFPPAVERTPNAALYGIEATNRGCDLNVSFNAGKSVPPARALNGLPCNFVDTRGCGLGPLTGKQDSTQTGRAAQLTVNPGGVPIFRAAAAGGAVLLGGVGVTGIPLAEAEYAAFQGAFQPPVGIPFSALGSPGVVFIDGVRLPFVRHLRPPAGSAPGAPVPAAAISARDGDCVPDGYLVGPRAGNGLSAAEVDRIVQQAIAGARRTRAVIRLPAGSRARMVFAVGDLDGELLALYRMPDAPVFSIDVAAAKARNVVYFSSGDPAAARDLPAVPAGTAVTNRTLSFAAQPLFPAGISAPPGPFFDLFRADVANPCSQGSQTPNANQNGIVWFPGSIPLYRGDQLTGGLGVSGDGVEQDDYVSWLGSEGFRPPERLWADRVFVRGVRLPFLKFPRNPER